MAFEATTGTLVAGAIFTALLIVAALSDFRTRRVPNALVVALALGGVAYSLETIQPVQGTGFVLGGLGVGLFVAGPFRYLRWLRAGDVKLAAAAGIWLGSVGSLRAAAAAAVISLALAVGPLVWQRTHGAEGRELLVLLASVRRRPFVARYRAPVDAPQVLPFGVAIALGAILAGWMR